MRQKFATPVLIACTLFLGLTTGAGLFEHLFGIPQLLSSPATLAKTFAGNTGQPQKFWIPLHALIFITLVLSLILNWKSKQRKKLIVYVCSGYLYISLVSIYFAKKLFEFAEMSDGAVYQGQAQQWLLLSWHRPVLMIVLEVMLLVAVAREGEKAEAGIF